MKTVCCWLILLNLLFTIDMDMAAQIVGCTDPLSKNYNPEATVNDGSCQYKKAAIRPEFSKKLDQKLHETSGLIFWEGKLWTHNDDRDTSIYGLDTISGGIQQTYQLKNVINKDWEEISQDSSYLYIGDFGNNVAGNRADLHILRIEKKSLAVNPVIDTISFRYSDQVDFIPSKANQTDYDGEAMVVSKDSIYIFTKQWKSKNTTLYSLPKTPGNHVAQLKAVHDIRGLVTGAVFLESENAIVLCGYSKHLKPFLYLLYDFKDVYKRQLSAKPIIDILIGLPDGKDLDKTVFPLIGNGYIYYEKYNLDMPYRRFFVKHKDEAKHRPVINILRKEADIPSNTEEHDERIAHIHIVPLGSEHWTRHIAFRDYLIAHPKIKEEYQKLKSDLIQREWLDGNHYNGAKDTFIKTEEKKAVNWYGTGINTIVSRTDNEK